MNRQQRAKRELEIDMQTHPPSNDECSYCHTGFYGSACSRESHMKLYPGHFDGSVQVSGKVEACTQDLVPKIKKAKHSPKIE